MNNFKRIRVLFCDHLNLARGKYLPIAVASSETVRHCIALYALGYDRVMVDAPGSKMKEGLPDLEAVFQMGDVRECWEPATGVVIADLLMNRAPLPFCGRSLLKNAIADWKSMGYTVNVGIELEAFLFQRDDNGKWAPYHTPGAYVYGTGASSDPLGLIDCVWEEADRLGFPVEAINSEYDWPQFEFTLKYDEALSAVDDAFLFKLLAKEVLAKKGYLLSFMPKPLSDRGGSGLHLNISLLDEAGKNAMHDPAQEDGLSVLSKQMIAGLLEHHQGMAGLLAPTVNSYRRLRPYSMSGYWANWGYDHRGTTIRIPPDRAEATRIEYRLADCAVNPYLAVAASLQVARLGVTRDYTLPPAETGDGLTKVDTDRCVAETLGGALRDLEADEQLINAVGEAPVRHLVAVKRKEWNDFLNHTTDWELDMYFEFL